MVNISFNRILIFSLGPLAILLAFIIGLHHQPQPVLQTSSVAEQSELDYVNAVRKDHKLPALAYDAGLNKVAALKVQDMINRHYWKHTTPDGKPFYYLAETTRPGLKYYGENIGQCFTTQKALFAAYAASPEHLANILNRHYTRFGASTLYDATKHCFINSNEFGG